MRVDGLLFFPLTPFDSAGEVAPDVLERHVADGVDAGVGGVFVACGTGEFHALAPVEYERAVRATVGTVDRRVPVVAGAGGALPHAIAYAEAAERAGADGLLLMPPYLVGSSAAGLEDYVLRVAAATNLSVVIYQRNNARFSPESAARLAAHPTVVGFKDGLGDIEQVQRIVLAVREEVGEDFLFFNGLPTAEMSAAAYRGAGVRLYSSAAFAFVPEVATAFYDALTNGDDHVVRRLLTDFYSPLTELRDKVPGYAVSLVKAGARIRGLDAGSVRAPLTDPAPEHMAALESLIETGLRAIKE